MPVFIVVISAPLELAPFDAKSQKDILSEDQIMDIFKSQYGEKKSADVKVISSDTVFRMRYRLISYVEKRKLERSEERAHGSDARFHRGMMQPIL